MRPIDRRERPLDLSGNPKIFKQYKDARGDLIDRLGQYCSYCEMKLTVSLAVEYIQPKSIDPELDKEWDNFLLACTNCNSTKSNKDIALEEYYWPHLDNTFRAFVYLKDGKIRPNPTLTDAEKQKARAMIELVGLQKLSPKDGRQSDRRQQNRRETWEIAEKWLGTLQQTNTFEIREAIIDLAKAQGFWSVWMTVFKNDPDMLNHFIVEFPGTCRECFDSLGNPIPRPKGKL